LRQEDRSIRTWVFFQVDGSFRSAAPAHYVCGQTAGRDSSRADDAIKAELEAAGIYLEEEVERFSAVYFKPRQRQSALDHQAINAALDPAVSRFMATVSRCYTGVYACSANIHRIER
jgi:hypothetical protein